MSPTEDIDSLVPQAIYAYVHNMYIIDVYIGTTEVVSSIGTTCSFKW